MYEEEKGELRNICISFICIYTMLNLHTMHFILPSSMLVRLVNISMFRCNNKMLFVTIWIQQNNSLISKKYIRSNKYLVSELKNSIAPIFITSLSNYLFIQ
ncbi:hypothetical protein Csa_023620 [Cucumis sativus]|nr:hypothetical protein Csa_023620 [Cucumis sativus]